MLSARAGTPIAEIEALLAANGQELAFEPMDYGPLFGGAAGRGTIGGVLAANLSGPRRIKAGAARDHFLGFTAVSGRGETFKSGGRVVKNVTGYDLCKLLAGSWGTLAAMTDVTVKVLPRAETEADACWCSGSTMRRPRAAMSARDGLVERRVGRGASAGARRARASRPKPARRSPRCGSKASRRRSRIAGSALRSRAEAVRRDRRCSSEAASRGAVAGDPRRRCRSPATTARSGASRPRRRAAHEVAARARARGGASSTTGPAG